MNMFVPVALLRPILNDLLTLGRVNQPPRPWLGVYVMESEGGLVVQGMADGGPADKAGVQAATASSAWARAMSPIWPPVAPALGQRPRRQGVRLRLSRDGNDMALLIVTADRATFLRAPRLH